MRKSTSSVSTVTWLVILSACGLTLYAGCGVSGGGGGATRSQRNARDATAASSTKAPDAAAPAGAKTPDVWASPKSTAPAADAPAEAPVAAAPATTPPRDGNLLVLQGDLSKRYQPSNGGDSASFRLNDDPARPGLVVTFPASNAGYPGINLKPEGDAWDLSKYGDVQFTVTNVGDKAALFACRVDNEGSWQKNPWNTEQAHLKPGEERTVKIIFGHQYGHKPGYKLDPSKVVNILMFTTRVKDGERKFLVEKIVAAGSPGEKPPVNPKNVRIEPVDGYVMGLSTLKVKASAKNGTAKVVADGAKQHVEAGLNGKGASLFIGPHQGRWNLTSACEVRAKITNTGDAPVTPTLYAFSDRNRTRAATAAAPLAPGASVELVSSFVAQKPPVFSPTANKIHGGPERGTGTKYYSRNTNGVTITTGNTPARLRVEYVKATSTPVELPHWVGRRPPVPGDWKMTLDEDFDGATVNRKLWSVYGPNWWGAKKLTHWSKDNVIVENGTATVLFEKKTGWHNDNEKTGHKTDFAGGYLDSYGLWHQKYGYFECRMKLPEGPGLWPAFWMMPDRGTEAGPHWKRQDTGKGGMEFDIMEHLTGWGPHRYHVAMHWDGYGKNHKSVGSDVYIRHDADGYFTSGCLWLPGKLVYYCNGEVVASWESERVCSQPMNIMFTMPIGGWANTRFDPDALPMRWDIDYVRVWQRKDLASNADGYLPTPSTWPATQK